MPIRFLVNWLLNPTRSWPKATGNSLVLDLDRGCLCDVPRGYSLERLRFLGPGELASFGLRWPEQGITVGSVADRETKERRITSFTFFFDHEDIPEEGGFTGICQYRNQQLPLNRELTEAQAIEILGIPYWRDQDDEEVILFYEIDPETEWQLEFGENGKLKCLLIDEPLLADSEQRENYGVTEPWPPTYA